MLREYNKKVTGISKRRKKSMGQRTRKWRKEEKKWRGWNWRNWRWKDEEGE